MNLISSCWDTVSHASISRLLVVDTTPLYHELNQLRRELHETDRDLNCLVFQAARQAIIKMQRECQSIDIMSLGTCAVRPCPKRV
jgi:hypothetical protein